MVFRGTKLVIESTTTMDSGSIFWYVTDNVDLSRGNTKIPSSHQVRKKAEQIRSGSLSLSLFIFVSLKGLWYISLKIALLADWLGALGEGTFAKGLGKKADGNDKGFFTISSFLRKIFL